MGVLWQIFLGGSILPVGSHVSPTGKIEPPKKSATERPIIYVCKIKKGVFL